MQRRLGDALAVYVDAMRYPRGTEDQRASMWLEHTRRRGWKAVAAVEVPDETHRPPTWPPRPCSEWPTATAAPPTSGGSSRWSQGLHRVGADRSQIAELMTSYFELTELHIAPRAQGRGLGEALARRLLADRGESHVLLSTPEINGEANRAVAAVPPARVHRHHPRLPLRRRSPRLRHPRPGTAAPMPTVRSGTMTTCAPPNAETACWPCGAAAAVRADGGRLCADQGVDHGVARRPGVRADRRGGQAARADDQGPQLLNSLPFSNKVAVSKYERRTTSSARRRCSPISPSPSCRSWRT